MTEEQPVDLECRANGAFPQGDLHWFIDNQEISEKNVENTPNSNGRFDITSTTTFNPTRNDNGKYIKCTVTHESLKPGEEKSTSERINVKCKYMLSA